MIIECPKDIKFENTFSQDECEIKKFYGDCFHCWDTAIAKHDAEIRADERAKTIREIEQAMYHQCFEVDNPEDLQKWDSGNWFRYKLFENVLEQLKESKNV